MRITTLIGQDENIVSVRTIYIYARRKYLRFAINTPKDISYTPFNCYTRNKVVVNLQLANTATLANNRVCTIM